jgi:exoribonuclease R
VHNRVTRSPRLTGLDFDDIRAEAGVPGPFPGDALAEAGEAARSPRRTDDDATDLPLVTIDPPGSRDLDQAMGIDSRADGGWRVHYAIADLGAWVVPGGALDRTARARTQTYYSPDRHDPLHPPVLGTAAASLLPDGDRPAALWTLDVAPDGTLGDARVRRAMVRSRAQLTYDQVQEAADRGTLPDSLAALPALGTALLADARRRGAVELGLPEQAVVPHRPDGWTLALRATLPVERWNAQISLLTGRAAARLMIDHRVGLLRTVPAVDPSALPRLRTAAAGLGIDWPAPEGPGAVLSGLDMGDARHAAFADLAAELLRGAGYTAVAGTVPADPGHAGVGAPYTHVTAPLRRLVDRFTTEVCLALCAGRPVPGWVEEALPDLPEVMREGDGRARTLDRLAVDVTEAFVLRDRVGETFPASVMETGASSGTVVLEEPAVRARCDGADLPLGAVVTVRCTEADVARRSVRFAWVP